MARSLNTRIRKSILWCMSHWRLSIWQLEQSDNWERISLLRSKYFTRTNSSNYLNVSLHIFDIKIKKNDKKADILSIWIYFVKELDYFDLFLSYLPWIMCGIKVQGKRWESPDVQSVYFGGGHLDLFGQENPEHFDIFLGYLLWIWSSNIK